MEYIKENIDNVIQKFIERYDGSKTFTEAYEKNVPFYFKRHKTLIVPSSMVNLEFGCSEFRMDTRLTEELKKYGARRCTRQLYKNGVSNTSVLCWVFSV